MIYLEISEQELELIVVMTGDAMDKESDLTKLKSFFTLRTKTTQALEAERNTDS